MDKAQIDPELLLECVLRMTVKQRSELAGLLSGCASSRQCSEDRSDAVLYAMQASFRATMLERELERRKSETLPPLVPFVVKNDAVTTVPRDDREKLLLGDGLPYVQMIGGVDLDATMTIKQEPVWPSDAANPAFFFAGRPADRTSSIGPTTEAALVVHNGERRLLAVDPTRQYVTVTNDAHLEVRFDYGRPGAIEVAGTATINKIVRDWGDHKEMRPIRLLSLCPDNTTCDYKPIAAAIVDAGGRLTVQFHPPGSVERSITLGAAPTAVKQELHQLKGWPTVEVNHTTLTHLKRWRDDTAHNLPD